MAEHRSSLATGFLTIFGLGALGVAMIIAGLVLHGNASHRAETAERDAAALVLLSQRQALAGAIAAEQSALAFDLLDGHHDGYGLELTLARQGTQDDARQTASSLAARGDTVGEEAARWLTTLEHMPDPAAVADGGTRRLMAYEEAYDAACCEGHHASDAHHADGLRDLEEAITASTSVWDLFYMSIRGVGTVPRSGPTPVLQFIGTRGVAGRLPPFAPSATDSLKDQLAPLIAAGVPEAAVDDILATPSAGTLNAVVEHATLRSLIAVPSSEAYVAALEVAGNIDSLYAQAVATAVAGLDDEAASAVAVQRLLIVVVPLLFAVLAAVGLFVYRLAGAREASLLRERQALESRDRFMRMVSHELRTPAAAISGFAEMLTTDRAALSDEEIDEFLSIIDRQSKHLAVIVDDLLTLTKLEAGKLRVEREDVHLLRAAEEAALMVERRHGLHIDVDVDSQLTAIADADRVVQVLRNLLENAAKYGQKGVAIRAGAAAGTCEVVVSDEGPGVPPDKVETIFGVWVRAEDDEGAPRGYGIGLPVARLLAVAMGGGLAYRPNTPTGSCFVLSLPSAGARRPDVDVPVPAPQPETLATT